MNQRAYLTTVLVLVNLGSVATGCRFFEANEDEEPVALVGTVWELTAVETADGIPLQSPEPPGAYQLYFHPGTCAESLNACNTCFGTYRAYEGGELGLVQACTEMACDSGLYTYQGDYGLALSGAVQYWIDLDRLFIRVRVGNGEEQVLVHRASPEADSLQTYCVSDERAMRGGARP